MKCIVYILLHHNNNWTRRGSVYILISHRKCVIRLDIVDFDVDTKTKMMMTMLNYFITTLWHGMDIIHII